MAVAAITDGEAAPTLPRLCPGAASAAAAALVVALGDKGTRPDPASDRQPQDVSWQDGLCRRQRRSLGTAGVPSPPSRLALLRWSGQTLPRDSRGSARGSNGQHWHLRAGLERQIFQPTEHRKAPEPTHNPGKLPAQLGPCSHRGVSCVGPRKVSQKPLGR